VVFLIASVVVVLYVLIFILIFFSVFCCIFSLLNMDHCVCHKLKDHGQAYLAIVERLSELKIFFLLGWLELFVLQL